MVYLASPFWEFWMTQQSWTASQGDADTQNSDSKPLQGTEGASKLAVKSSNSFN